MSTKDNDAPSGMKCCASCGKPEVDDIKLKKCAACGSAWYCNVNCQREHRQQHKSACKKRAAELRDELLFRQPESSHLGDCPICLLPLSLDPSHSPMQICCLKVICFGCFSTDIMHNGRKNYACPFCRCKLTDKSESKLKEHLEERIKVNDPVAMRKYASMLGEKGDYTTALAFYKRSAALGDAEAHYHVGMSHAVGRGVEKNEKKKIHHLEEAAILGHTKARHMLGLTEMTRGREERGVKHYIISATLGDEQALDELRVGHKMGYVQKEDLVAAQIACQKAVDAARSPERELAYKVQAEYLKLGKQGVKF